MKCKPDKNAELLSEAFHITMEKYKDIVNFLTENFRKNETVADMIEKIRNKYKDDCEFLLAVFTLGRLYQGVLILSEIYGGLKQIPVFLVPVMTPNTETTYKEGAGNKKRKDNGASTLWG